jgi:DNA-binding NarL/FixJ family response regulator
VPSFFVFARQDERARSLASVCAELGQVSLVNSVTAAQRQLSGPRSCFISLLLSVGLHDADALALLDELPRARPPTVVICSTPSPAIVNAVFESGASLICHSAAPRMLPPFLRRVMADHSARRVQVTVPNEVMERMQLTPREGAILQLALDGAKRGEIALALGITEGTAKWHIRSLLSKCEARSLTELSCNILRRARDLTSQP